MDKEIEDIKEKLKKNQTEKDENMMKQNKAKLEQQKKKIRAELEKEENSKVLKLKQETQAKIEEVSNGYSKLLQEEKKKIMEKYSSQTEESLKLYQKNFDTEIESLKDELRLVKQKIDFEEKEKLEIVKQHEKKMGALKIDYEKELEHEKKLIEKDTERQIKAIKQEENGELSLDDRTVLYNLEKELSSNLHKEISAIHAENELKLMREKEKISEMIKSKTEKQRLEKEILLKDELQTKEYELRSQLNVTISQYTAKKESQLLQDIQEYEKKLKRSLEAEENQYGLRSKLSLNYREDEEKSALETQIRGLQREIANAEHILYTKNIELNRLKDEEAKLVVDIKRTEIETEDLKGQDGVIEEVVIADLEKQIQEKENEINSLASPGSERVMRLEREVGELKKILSRQKLAGEESEKMKIALSVEKEELKHLQNMLKIDREKWNKEMKEYKAKPTEKKRHELYNIKRIIEKNIQKHNDRVKELKQAEKVMKNNYNEASEDEEEELILEMWRNTDSKSGAPVQYSRQPWQNHNLHVYQRQVNKWRKSREYMKDIITRHGSWLNNMKDQLNRVMSTPHSIKKYY